MIGFEQNRMDEHKMASWQISGNKVSKVSPEFIKYRFICRARTRRHEGFKEEEDLINVYVDELNTNIRKGAIGDN